MLSRALNMILSDPALIPLYAFAAFLVGFLFWEVLKLGVFIIRNWGSSKK